MSVMTWWDGMLRAPGRWRESLRRAREYSGTERETAVLVVKSAAAAVASWSIATYVAASPQPTYAPFTSLLVVQATAYRSLLQTVRYVAAVLVGVFIAGAVGPLLGDNALAFAVMLAFTLAIGRWQRLGAQGLQVSVAAVFAYNALSGTHVSALWHIVAMALVGAVVGIVVALLVAPPLRYRSAARGIEDLCHSVQALLCDMAEALDDGLPEPDTAQDWLYRARALDNTVSSARYAVEAGAESVVYNPRRLLNRYRSTSTSFRGYRTLVESLARAAEQLRSIAYGLRRMSEASGGPRPGDDFLLRYAGLLRLAADAAAEIGCLDEDGDGHTPLRRVLDEAHGRHDDLAHAVDGAAAWASHGVLLTDADRLLEEFAHAHASGAAQPRGRA